PASRRASSCSIPSSMLAIIRTRWHTRPLSPRAKRRSSAAPGSLRKKYAGILSPQRWCAPLIILPHLEITESRYKDPVFGVIGIRRAYFAQNKPIKTICRDFRVSRRVVRKVIRSQATEFRYERSRQPRPRIDPWRDQLDSLLLENEGKPARERLTLIRLFEELRALG